MNRIRPIKKTAQRTKNVHFIAILPQKTFSLHKRGQISSMVESRQLFHRKETAMAYSDLALGVDLHGLLVAGGSQRHAGGKSRSLDEHLDLAAARRALQIAEKVPARFGPVAVNAVTLARNVGTQVEFVAVAGAAESLLQTQSGAVDIVGGLASDALGCSVGKRDCAVAGPRSVKAGKWPRLGMAYRHRQHERTADSSNRDSLSEQPGTKQFHIEFSHSNDVLM